MDRHKTELIKFPHETERVKIDKELVPLIKELNKVGLKTIQCCQGGKNTLAADYEKDAPAHIVFELGINVMCQIKPLGAYGKQTLVISWKKGDQDVLL